MYRVSTGISVREVQRVPRRTLTVISSLRCQDFGGDWVYPGCIQAISKLE